MIPKSFDEISIGDLQQLIENKVPEGKTIEYKAELRIEKDSEKKEFLYDVSSFANSIGGDLIFGIAEGSEKGIPNFISGFSCKTDETIIKVESILRSSINPRILGIQIKTLALESGNILLLLRIPNSLNAPHQVTYQGVDRFYCRSNNGKYPFDVFELRNAFMQSSFITDKIRQFVNNRISKIISGHTPVNLEAHPKIVLHIVPIQAIEGNRLGISNTEIKSAKLFPLGSSGYSSRFNLEGVVNFSRLPNEKQAYAYIQIYRTGIIESVNADLLRPYQGKKVIAVDKSFSVEAKIISFVTESIEFLKKMNVSLPIYIFLTLIDVKGYGLGSSRLRQLIYEDQRDGGIDREILAIPEIEVREYPDHIDYLVREWFENIWNACGYEKCFSYDDTGNFIGF